MGADPLEQLLYDPERDGPMKTAQELAEEQEAHYQRLLRTGGTLVLVRSVKSVPSHFKGKRGVVVGCHQEECPTCRQQRDVVDIRLEGADHPLVFYPHELSSPSAMKRARAG